MMLELAPLTPQGLTGRVLRGSLFTLLGFGGAQALRLLGNLILARLLFPEAFGIMALVSVLLFGLQMLSDLGISPAIQGSPRGDDPVFLDTAWSLTVIRGAILFLLACLAARPMAAFYEEPLLAQVIPVAALALPIGALAPTRIDRAERHLTLGLMTSIELAGQAVALVAMVLFAAVAPSIWALVLGSIVQAAARSALAWILLPGPPNRFRIEPSAAWALIHFGVWVFFSTIAGFVMMQADKLVLARYVSMGALGLYNIGSFLAGFPVMLGTTLVVRLMIPVYRTSPPGESKENFLRLRRIRAALTGVLIAAMAPFILAGPQIVGLLYDFRYAEAGVIVVLLGLALLPQVVTLGYDRAALAAGDSRGFFVVNALRAGALVICLLHFVPKVAVAGAALALALAWLVGYPAQVWLARRHSAWDGLHDLVAFAVIGVLVALAWLLHGPALAAMGASLVQEPQGAAWASGVSGHGL